MEAIEELWYPPEDLVETNSRLIMDYFALQYTVLGLTVFMGFQRAVDLILKTFTW